ncbi:MAG TPA: L-2-hydroxyglutarate oxidase [Solirubrobacteraceae bacterium]|nr:L-2-hydroxyglutarate oxidase [Solirubrobacteraceae bacterium]
MASDVEIGTSAAQAPARCDVAIVGGGILGLAVARELLQRQPQMSVCVLEREREVGTHQTGHNSGVVHAGIYYTPGSLKARLCVAGARELYEYCARREIPYETCGKVIVATDASELGRLDELERRGRANRVPGLVRLDAAGIRALEPHAVGIAGLHSPATGIVSFPAVARAYAQDVAAGGGAVVLGCEVRGVRPAARTIRLEHSHGATEAGHAIFCAGAWADRLAVAAGADPEPRIVPFRGAYLRLAPARRELVRSLIYPVPDPSLPFLGVHLTKHIDGEVLIGPTALLAGARDAYSLRTIRPRDIADTLAWPGAWRMFAHWWRTGLTELRHAAVRAAFVRAAARYVPELRLRDVQPAFAGVRAQALARDGRLVDDFVFSATDRALHVRNAPSPAATSSLAIARHVVDHAQRAFRI